MALIIYKPAGISLTEMEKNVTYLSAKEGVYNHYSIVIKKGEHLKVSEVEKGGIIVKKFMKANVGIMRVDITENLYQKSRFLNFVEKNVQTNDVVAIFFSSFYDTDMDLGRNEQTYRDVAPHMGFENTGRIVVKEWLVATSDRSINTIFGARDVVQKRDGIIGIGTDLSKLGVNTKDEMMTILTSSIMWELSNRGESYTIGDMMINEILHNKAFRHDAFKTQRDLETSLCFEDCTMDLLQAEVPFVIFNQDELYMSDYHDFINSDGIFFSNVDFLSEKDKVKTKEKPAVLGKKLTHPPVEIKDQLLLNYLDCGEYIVYIQGMEFSVIEVTGSQIRIVNDETGLEYPFQVLDFINPIRREELNIELVPV
jgi:hypothetical protein